MKGNLTSFQVLTVFTLVSLIGFCLIPVLNLQLVDAQTSRTVRVDFEWPRASAEIMERDLTSVLENVFGTIDGVEHINSTSRAGRGSITVTFKESVDLDFARFSLANVIRQNYERLPERVPFPIIASGRNDSEKTTLVTYSIHSNQPTREIEAYLEKNLVPKLLAIEGVNDLRFDGAAPLIWRIRYNPLRLQALNLSVSQLADAIRAHFVKRELGKAVVAANGDQEMSIIYSGHTGTESLDEIPIHKNSRVIYLSDVATTTLDDSGEDHYFRVNGKNTILMTLSGAADKNVIALNDQINRVVAEAAKNFPGNYEVMKLSDVSNDLKSELRNLTIQSVCSIIILAVFIFFAVANVRYLVVVLMSLIVTMACSGVLYQFFALQINLYALAGISISFCIVIDNIIVMMEHFRRKADRRVFLAILSAVLTMVGAISVIFLLDQSQQTQLTSFAVILMINLIVSLVVVLVFVPAAMHALQVSAQNNLRINFHRQKLFAKVRHPFAVTVVFFSRYRGVLIVLVVFAFGLPVGLLPQKLEGEGWFARSYNDIVATPIFRDIKVDLENYAGGSLQVFKDNVIATSFPRQPGRTSITIQGEMPDGGTVDQLNKAVVNFEQFLAQFDEVDFFQTTITSAQHARLDIYFDDAVASGIYPYQMKARLEALAIKVGGVDWSIYGVGRGFSNAISGYKNSRLKLKGYNYEQLKEYAAEIKLKLQSRDRVKDVVISSGSSGFVQKPSNVFALNFDDLQLAGKATSYSGFYDALSNQILAARIDGVILKDKRYSALLGSDQFNNFDIWRLKNTPLRIGDNYHKLNYQGAVAKHENASDIYRSDQEYELSIAYDFTGPDVLLKKTLEEIRDEVNNQLPIGYRLRISGFGWNVDDGKQYYFLLIGVVIIFFICSILLGSIWQSVIIIGTVPISFIGSFLSFYISGVNFDEGGYASFVLLCGFSVNASLYILNEFNNLTQLNTARSTLSLFFKGFYYKIGPILFTRCAIAIGLIPIIWWGGETIWLSFAVGVIGGLIFNVIAIMLFFPAMIVGSFPRNAPRIC